MCRPAESVGSVVGQTKKAAPAATLMLDGLRASGLPETATDVYVEVRLLEVDEGASGRTQAAAGGTSELTWQDELQISLPVGSPRPALLKLQLCAAGGEPLASAEVRAALCPTYPLCRACPALPT